MPIQSICTSYATCAGLRVLHGYAASLFPSALAGNGAATHHVGMSQIFVPRRCPTDLQPKNFTSKRK